MPFFVYIKKKKILFRKNIRNGKNRQNSLEKKRFPKFDLEKSKKQTGLNFIFFFQISFVKINILRKIKQEKFFFLAELCRPILDLKWKNFRVKKNNSNQLINKIFFQKKKFFFIAHKKEKQEKFFSQKIKKKKKAVLLFFSKKNFSKVEKNNFLFLKKINNYFESLRNKNTEFLSINQILLKN
ncbi:hypothetical protein HAN_3g428 (nucleomorph) [Hemiselmis andersenii]|uniref:Uncharacterized protein n=1 Tax=Hemiselmis andersenii TaxID=464988 RepID=A9BL51_HEMAN|nr:hypothetical protein HAN_3g428 [Hemiselmis andersenii]ABW98234.1 hypothetical protein HAN_3g428 [Hemiselmis andersenii]